MLACYANEFNVLLLGIFHWMYFIYCLLLSFKHHLSSQNQWFFNSGKKNVLLKVSPP